MTFTVTNHGDVTADEVAQLYARAEGALRARPRRQLLAHRRLGLAPGERAEYAFEVPSAAFAYWDVAHGRWRLEPARTGCWRAPPARTSG
ncbi:Sugar hydrolase OS=Streptomyces fumanus OX=67302 GN=GCM10018772_52460 PE=4 SV=1 [Streptomyces fumanus]